MIVERDIEGRNISARAEDTNIRIENPRVGGEHLCACRGYLTDADGSGLFVGTSLRVQRIPYKLTI